MEEPGRLQSMGSQRVGHDWVTSLSRTGEGNGNPLQCSCLENPRDRRVWWAAVYGVAQSRTRLKWLSSSSSVYLGEGNDTPLQCSCLEIQWTEEPGRLQSMGSRRVGHDWVTSLSRTGEGNGNPLQYSCLENPRDRGAWWAAVYGVTQSRTRLKWLSSCSSS